VPQWMQGSAFSGEQQRDEPEFSYGLRGRMDERYDMVRSVRDKRYMYIRNYMPHRVYGQHVAYMFETPTTRVWQRLFEERKLNGPQRVFWRTKPAEELYDLWQDPHEIRNLVESPEHMETLARMRHALRQWTARVKDVGFLAEWEMHARAGDETPREMAQDKNRYDFDAVFTAAELATSLQENDLPEVVELLQHGDTDVRYWAATGLLAHGEAGVRAGHAILVAALSDDSPIVRIVAAEALGRFGSENDAEVALEVLLEYAQSQESYYLSMAAWNAIDHVDERARPSLRAIKALSVRAEPPSPRMGKYTSLLKRKTLADLQ
jgi:hypothetical protein